MTKSSKKKPLDDVLMADKLLPSEPRDDGPQHFEDRTPLSMVQLAERVMVRFEWLEGGTWKSKDIDGRIVLPHPVRDPSTTEDFVGVSVYHAGDHIQFEYKGCVRCVPFGSVKGWGFDPPQEVTGEAADNG